MKFTLSFKTPDVLDQLDGMSEDETEEANKLLKKFLKWSEYVNIEFDTETETARILEQ